MQSSTVTTVLSQRPNSNERPRAEQARPGPASGGHRTLFSSRHRLSELWTPTETKSVLSEENIPRNSPGGWNVILEFSSRKPPSLRSSLNLTSCFPRGGYIKKKKRTKSNIFKGLKFNIIIKVYQLRQLRTMKNVLLKYKDKITHSSLSLLIALNY